MRSWNAVRPRGAGILVMAVILLGWAAPGWAPNCPSGCRPTTTNIHLVLDDILQLPLVGGQTDPIPLTGNVHVMTHATPAQGGTFDVRILVNLHGVGGVGELTGTPYVAVGAARFEGQGLAASSLHEISGVFALESLLPPNPIVPPNPTLPLRVTIFLGANGAVREGAVFVDAESIVVD